LKIETAPIQKGGWDGFDKKDGMEENNDDFDEIDEMRCFWIKNPDFSKNNPDYSGLVNA